MSKKKIWVLAIVMTLGLLGLILVQGYWIKRAVILKEQQFKYFVNQALSAVINELEVREALVYVEDEMVLSGADSTAKPFRYSFSSYSDIGFQSEKENGKTTEMQIEANTSFYQQNFYLSESLQNNSFSILDSIGVSIIDPNINDPREIFSYPNRLLTHI